MGLMATARGRIQKRIVKVVTVTAGLASRLRLSRTAERLDRPPGRQLQAWSSGTVAGDSTCM